MVGRMIIDRVVVVRDKHHADVRDRDFGRISVVMLDTYARFEFLLGFVTIKANNTY
jgi:hypothetical protein